MRKIDRRIVIIAALIFTVGLAYGVMKFLIAQKEDLKVRPAIEAKRFVKAEPVKYKTIIAPVEERGRVFSQSRVDIIAEASGKIEAGKIPLKTGAGFKKGDLLFKVYSDEFELTLKARKSNFLNLLVNLLPDLKIDYPDYYESFKQFFNAIDLNKPLPQLPKYDNERIKVFLASRNILGEYYGILKDEKQLARYNVYAPFDGTYTQVNLEVGAYTNTGGRVAVAIQTSALELEVPLVRFDSDWVKIGDPVKIFTQDTDISWDGKVIRKNQFIDEETQTQGVYVKLSNHRKIKLLNGEYLLAKFSGHPIENAMEIPRNAVFNSNEVYIIKNGRLSKREINIIKKYEKTLIFNGINEGEVIVLQPLVNVLEGTKVEALSDIQQAESPKGQGKNKKQQELKKAANKQ